MRMQSPAIAPIVQVSIANASGNLVLVHNDNKNETETGRILELTFIALHREYL
jgi:hypothetical protein